MTTYCPKCPRDCTGASRPLLADGGTKCHGCGYVAPGTAADSLRRDIDRLPAGSPGHQLAQDALEALSRGDSVRFDATTLADADALDETYRAAAAFDEARQAEWLAAHPAASDEDFCDPDAELRAAALSGGRP